MQNGISALDLIHQKFDKYMKDIVAKADPNEQTRRAVNLTFDVEYNRPYMHKGETVL